MITVTIKIGSSDILFIVIYAQKAIVITIYYNHDYSAFRISITIMITITGRIFSRLRL